jgi:putative ABC transport system permease protein
VIDQLKPKWEAAYSEHIFSYEFMDEQIRHFYESEQRTSVMLAVFSGIAIFIGCLGLFGLATFLSNQKTKEIGVRKVLGASVESIVFLFSKEYIKLIALGFLISAPMSWFVMGKFLEDFEYRINIGPGIFVVGFVATLLIAVVTVGYRSMRAAGANPATALRSE